MKYVCTVCGYVYDEEAGDPDRNIPAGTKWEDVPEDYLCPLCGVGKDMFAEELSYRPAKFAAIFLCVERNFNGRKRKYYQNS